ncbi:hypothetical protein BKK51_04435 [Rodentibacter trehalosifermentans]|uniref:Factor H binding protein-like C-terminal domain-containing protein n=1 Tax=Rodentibacter trehalosifermentans TaxID=1908263 RepID=A0A1V3IUK1_9PAST|nr:factor H binding protein domain-containing protein [Rodentibacter trehalosifermentans]OOF45976.1 hypothetical protein BKK51_04435 [Rodentibacter trehalosifermentans]
MKLKNISVATALLLALTGCGSSGGGGSSDRASSTPNNEIRNDQSTQDQASQQQAELDKLKSQLEQAEQKVADATKRLEAETAKANREAQAKQAVQQELNNAKTQLAQAEQKVADTTKRLEAETAKATSEDQAKQAVQKELNDAKATLEQAQTNLATALANATKQEQKINEFNELIKEVVGNQQGDGSTIGGYANTQIDDLPNGLNSAPYVVIYAEDGQGTVSGGYATIYKQNYSVVYGRDMRFFSDSLNAPNNFRIEERGFSGEKTTALPSEGNATYKGKAFTSNPAAIIHSGDLTYNVDFANRTGSGKLSGFSGIGDINLDEGRIGKTNHGAGPNYGVASSASMADGTRGEYDLVFYGPDAEEIAGNAYMYKQLDNTMRVNGGTARKYNQKDEQGNLIRGTHIGFGGTRGEIQK